MRRVVATPSVAAFTTTAFFVLATALGPFLGDHAAFRYPQTLLAVGLAVWWWRRPGDLEAPLHPAAFATLAAASWVWCFGCAATHFLDFEISGLDFSIFEWMVGSTHQGHFGYSRIYEVNHFGVHSTFLMLLLVPIHALVSSPWVLLVTGATVVWAGLYPVRRLVRWANHGTPHGGLELVAVTAWLGNPWLGGLLNSGFRIEAFIPVATLWFLVGWVENRRWLWVLAMAALWCSKEDTCLFLASFALGAAVVERARWREALALAGASLAWLGAYVGVVQPALLGHAPTYTQFWAELGSSLPSVAFGVLTRPVWVVTKLVTSGVWAVALPALFVPFRSLRATLGMAPTVLLLGVATYEPMHQFKMYYPVPLVAFVVFGALEAWRRATLPRSLVFVSLLTFPLFWGGYGRVVPVNRAHLEGLAAVREAVARDRVVCAQTILFPHLGVDSRLVPLGEIGLCMDKPEVTVVINPELDTDPHNPSDFKQWLVNWERERDVTNLPGGYKILRAKGP